MNPRHQFLWLILLLLLPVLHAHAQGQQAPADSIKKTDEHSPGMAVLMSTVLPGAGQVYNNKYWKVPILYAGFAACGYFIHFNNGNYRKYRKAYLKRADGDSTTVDEFTGIYSESNLLDLKDYYRRNRDLTIIITAAVYVMNLLDAYVDAHLFNFNVNDNLSLRVMPDLRMGTNGMATTGFHLNLTFR